MSAPKSNLGKTQKKALPPDSERCTSVDFDHETLRCNKLLGHPMNWHEAEDTGGATIHTWIDPARRISSVQHSKASGLL